MKARSLGHVVVATLIAFSGCGDDEAPYAPDPDPDRPARFTTAAQVIDAYAQAMDDRDLELYVALLEPPPIARAPAGFRWYPQVTDVVDFPWLGGESYWGLAAEVDMIANMFNPDFVSDQTGQSVDSIQVSLSIESTGDLPDSETKVITHAVVTVLWAENSGMRSDVRLEFLLIRGGDGLLRIRTIRELMLIGREDSSFSAIKALYRSIP